jgi:hypothetical protein
VTVARLMEISPIGTIDPTPFLYDKPFYLYAGFQAVAFAANCFVKPVSPKYYEANENKK